MGRALAVTLILGLLVGTTALRTGVNATNSLESVTAEVGRRCKAADFVGAMKTLEEYGEPIGAESGKELVQACFLKEHGECEFGEAECSWMQKCLGRDGPCEPPPIAEILNRIPAGKTVMSLAQMAAAKDKSDTFSAQGLVNAIKAVLPDEGTALKQIPPELEELKQKQMWKALSPLNKTMWKANSEMYKVGAKVWDAIQKTKVSKKDKYNLWVAKSARDMWLSYMPEPKNGNLFNYAFNWFKNLGLLGMFVYITCGMEYDQVKMVGPKGIQSPVYAWFAPYGLFKSPAYTYPVFKSKRIKKREDWKCLVPGGY